jgi:O-antigen/teichoic acid export membrane protein
MLFKVAGFLLAFIYLDPQYLSTAAFGEWGILKVTGALISALFGLGLSNGVLKLWAEPEHENARDALAFTALLAIGALAGAAVVVLLALAAPLARLLLGDAAQAPLVQLLAVYVAAQMVLQVPKELIRIHERVGLFVLMIFGRMVVLVGGVYYFLVVQGAGLQGMLYAQVLSLGLGAAVLTVGMLRVVRWQVQGAFVRRLARLGMPLMLAGVAYLFLDAGDRYLLKWLGSDAAVGVYEWAARLGAVLNLLVVRSLWTAFHVLGVKDLKGDTREADFHRRTFRHFSIWGPWAVLGLSLAAYDITRLVASSPAYLAAERLVFPIAVGFLFYGIYYLLVNILYAGGETGTIAVNVFVAALANAALNVLLIPVLGAMGAAVATALAYLVLVLLTVRVIGRTTESVFPWGTLARALLLAGVLYGLGLVSTDWSAPARIGYRAGLILLYLPLVPAVRLYTWAEVKEITGYLRERVAEARSDAPAPEAAPEAKDGPGEQDDAQERKDEAAP